METSEKEKLFEELLQKITVVTDYVDSLAEASMHVAMIGHADEGNAGKWIDPDWKASVLMDLACLRSDLLGLADLKSRVQSGHGS